MAKKKSDEQAVMPESSEPTEVEAVEEVAKGSEAKAVVAQVGKHSQPAPHEPKVVEAYPSGTTRIDY